MVELDISVLFEEEQEWRGEKEQNGEDEEDSEIAESLAEKGARYNFDSHAQPAPSIRTLWPNPSS